jgi:hypothetical protein
MFKDMLRLVLATHPLRYPHLYAIYVSRRPLRLKIRTFIDHVVEQLKELRIVYEDA